MFGLKRIAPLLVCIFIFGIVQASSKDACDPCQTEKSDCYRCVTNKGCNPESCISHSFFKPRQTTPNNMMQHNLSLYWWYHDVVCEDDCSWWTMQVTPFVEHSVHGENVAEYFFPCKKSCIEVKEDGNGDVGSLWLNLIAGQNESFVSAVSMRPERKVAGVYFNFRFDASRFVCHSWLDIAFAALHVKHDIHYCEDTQVPGVACDVETVCQALNQPDWQYGKFNTCQMTRRGVDDVQLRYGYDWFYCDTDHLSPYFVATIPTGKRSSASTIFEPTVGSSHGSVGLGIIGDLRLYECVNKEITVLTDFKYRYVLGGCETRSFDLCKNGDWSRYLLIVQSDERSNSLPGINAFTQDVRVTPRSVIDWWLALHYKVCQWDIEIGYDLWWRQKELIRLCDFPKDLGIYDIVGDCNANPVSASCAMICQSITGDNIVKSDSTFVTLQAADLNLNSGATPRAISNTIYGALGYDGLLYEYPALIGFGAAYEAGHRGTALDNWSLWIKMGLAY